MSVHQWDPGSILWRAFFFFFPSPLSPRLAFLFFPSFFCPPLISSSPFPLPSFLFFFLLFFSHSFSFFFTSCFPLSAAFLTLFPPFILFSWFLPPFPLLSLSHSFCFCFFFLALKFLSCFTSLPRGLTFLPPPCHNEKSWGEHYVHIVAPTWKRLFQAS